MKLVKFLIILFQIGLWWWPFISLGYSSRAARSNIFLTGVQPSIRKGSSIYNSIKQLFHSWDKTRFPCHIIIAVHAFVVHVFSHLYKYLRRESMFTFCFISFKISIFKKFQLKTCTGSTACSMQFVFHVQIFNAQKSFPFKTKTK